MDSSKTDLEDDIGSEDNPITNTTPMLGLLSRAGMQFSFYRKLYGPIYEVEYHWQAEDNSDSCRINVNENRKWTYLAEGMFFPREMWDVDSEEKLYQLVGEDSPQPSLIFKYKLSLLLNEA